jgi:uracil-DNA glycosylase family 4
MNLTGTQFPSPIPHSSSPLFDPDCRACPRLAGFLDQARERHPGYWYRPVPPFGDASPRLLIVGLAPGFHGANRTGRPFTGDYAGVLLYETLHEYGYADRPVSVAADDGLTLSGCRITNAVKCCPPENKPETAEIVRCNAYLKDELAALPAGAAILALGLIAHGAVLRALGLKPKAHPFAHGAMHLLPSPWGGRRRDFGEHCSPPLEPARGATRAADGVEGDTSPDARRSIKLYDSYHCSRYNTQTHRLTPAMFKAVFEQIRSNQEGN